MKRRTLLTSAAALAAVATLPRVSFAQAMDKVKVGFIYVGPRNDGGWSQYHHEAAMKMKDHFGDKVELVEQESVPEGADAERVMTQMALGGAQLIVASSFGFMDATANVAAKFPNVKFEHATGYKTAPNMAVYNARFYEGRYVTGTIAGMMTKTNKIGYLASFPIPEVIQGINATYLAAKKVNPNVEIKVVWAFTWFDPAKEADGTQALIDQGCDFVFAHTDSTAPLATLKKAGLYGFGQAADMIDYAPSPRLGSIIDNWAPYYIDRVQAMLDGKWETANIWHGIKEGMVGLGEISSDVPADVKAAAEKVRDDIVSGAVKPFTGPLNKADGSVWLKEGEEADDATLAGLSFFVEGVNVDIPK